MRKWSLDLINRSVMITVFHIEIEVLRYRIKLLQIWQSELFFHEFSFVCFTLLGLPRILANIEMNSLVYFHDFCEALLEWVVRIRIKFILHLYGFWVFVSAKITTLNWFLFQRRSDIAHLRFWVLSVYKGIASVIDFTVLCHGVVIRPKSWSLCSFIIDNMFKFLALDTRNMPHFVYDFFGNVTFVSVL